MTGPTELAGLHKRAEEHRLKVSLSASGPTLFGCPAGSAMLPRSDRSSGANDPRALSGRSRRSPTDTTREVIVPRIDHLRDAYRPRDPETRGTAESRT